MSSERHLREAGELLDTISDGPVSQARVLYVAVKLKAAERRGAEQERARLTAPDLEPNDCCDGIGSKHVEPCESSPSFVRGYEQGFAVGKLRGVRAGLAAARARVFDAAAAIHSIDPASIEVEP